MESSDYHGVENSKSFIAINPIATVSIAHGVGTMLLPDGTTQEHAISADYDAARLINDFLSQFSIEGEGSNYCGLYGFTTFNAVRYFENISIKDETQKENDAADMQYTLFKSIAVFDHYSNELTLIELLSEGE
jgi:anthranilate synthase component 1